MAWDDTDPIQDKLHLQGIQEKLDAAQRGQELAAQQAKEQAAKNRAEGLPSDKTRPSKAKNPDALPGVAKLFLRLIGLALLILGGFLAISTLGSYLALDLPFVNIIPNIVLIVLFLWGSRWLFRLASR